MPPRTKPPAAARNSKIGKILEAIATGDSTTNRATATAKGTSTAGKKRATGKRPVNPARRPRKRKTREDEEQEEEEKEDQLQQARPAKKPRAAPTKTAVSKSKRAAKEDLNATKGLINEAPRHALDIFVFGEGSSGELGLGSKKYDNKKPIDVKRPRINHNLDATKVGVVQIACGGMHAIALTKENKIYTWGVNDDGALGRDTAWDGGVRDLEDSDSDSDSDDDDDDSGLNPFESTPGQVDPEGFPSSAVFTQVAATDSASFALTDEGLVYGWGTFRGSDGIIGFTPTIHKQPRPMLIPELEGIVKLACGSNHVVALDVSGKVYTWGSGGQFQLGRKATTRHEGQKAGLRPACCSKFNSRKYAVDIGAGSYHSFFIDNNKEVWGWGLNNYSQTGHSDNSGQDDAMVLMPRVIESLSGREVTQIVGGEHHTVACTKAGELLTWGRIDGHQVGHTNDTYTEENTVSDENNRPRILMEPTPISSKFQPPTGASYHRRGTDNDLQASQPCSLPRAQTPVSLSTIPARCIRGDSLPTTRPVRARATTSKFLKSSTTRQ